VTAVHNAPDHPLRQRRTLLAAALGVSLGPGLGWAQSLAGAPSGLLLVKRPLRFPQDLGSHPDTAIEWWYVTGALQAQQRLFGFQLTFFRSRVPVTQTMTSAFAARQLIFAHAAVTDVAGKRLLHDQRIARSSGAATVDLAHASTTDTDVALQDWSLVRRQGHYQAQVKGSNFGFSLQLTQTQPMLLQGDQGWSRKGPQAAQASFYYSLPQLQVSGELTLAGQTLAVQGRAWLDHEWSQSLMHPDAVGWDWIGMNLTDGSALTAFRLRTSSGEALWAGGSWRAQGAVQAVVFTAQDVTFEAERFWKSAASGTTYPVEWTVTVPSVAGGGGGVVAAGIRRFTVRAVIDAQELDSRSSTGAIYWEGLSDLLDDQGRRVGRGYLEMTGYASPLKLG